MGIDALNFMGELIDDKWTLFLDRDGVINRRLPGAYVSRISEFEFMDGLFESLSNYKDVLARIIVVTNQQGVSKGLMTKEELDVVHNYMLDIFESNGIEIDEIYVCSALASEEMSCRKPSPKMGLEAKMDFPEIVFSKSIMIGDSVSDMKFADHFGMKKILFLGKEEELEEQFSLQVDMKVTHWDEIAFGQM